MTTAIFLLVPGTQRSTSAGAHSTLHGVVFAILCPSPAVHRPHSASKTRVNVLTSAMPRLGHEIVSASRLWRIDSTPSHHAHVPGRETSVSLLVMNSSSTGMPSLVFAMPRRIAGMISSGLVTRSPWPPKARAMAA